MAKIDSGEAVIRSWSAVPVEEMAALDPEGDFVKKHLLNPTVFSMLGDVTDRRVLDAGCGQGYFSRLLAARGAIVVALEPADGLYQYAVAKEAELAQGVEFVQADLTEIELEPVFDAVVANMVFLCIPDWKGALRTCARALRPGGQLIFSIEHPCFEDASGHWHRTGHVEVTEYLADYVMPRRFAPDFHRPLSAYLNAVIAAGCRLTAVAEPRLAPELVGDLGPAAEALVHVPNFLVVSATRDSPG